MFGWRNALIYSPKEEGDYLVVIGYHSEEDDRNIKMGFRVMHFTPADDFDMPPFFWHKLPRVPKRVKKRFS